MRRAPGARQNTAGGTVSAVTGRTVTVIAVATPGSTRRRWGVSPPMPGACMTCTATCGSGYRIAGIIIIRERRVTAVPGPAGTAAGACLVVAPGATLRGSCVPRFAPGPPARSAATMSASVWPRTSRAKALYGLSARDPLPGFPFYFALFPFSV